MTDEVQTYQGEGTNQVGSPEHVHNMFAAMEEPINPSDVEEETYIKDSDRPEWLPEKFSSPEELANAYKNLEREFHANTQQTEQEAEVQRFQNEEVPEILQTTPSQVHKLLDEKGLDFSVFQEEYNETGTLSKEAMDALSEQGISEQMVTTWLQGQEALAEQAVEHLYNEVGGEENYDLMMQWAGDNLQPWEIEAYNKQIENLDANTNFAVLGLKARYQNAEGIPPNLMSGEVTGDIAPRFESLAELTSAMSDPKYEKDPAYRARVAQKLRFSNVL
tara:strand:- start:6182 stop:7009 length:828 start_codon:yes stop_codon:yes gene_type:complete